MRLEAFREKLLDAKSRPAASEGTSESSWCPRLSYQERIVGCVTCFVLGFVLSLGSTFRLARLVHGNPAPFAIAFTIGNMLSIGCTTFFVGPRKHVETMFHAKRRVSAVVYVVFMGVTLVLCLVARDHRLHHRLVLVLVSVGVQFLALVWYTLSYVPYGRHMVKSCCNRTFRGISDDENV